MQRHQAPASVTDGAPDTTAEVSAAVALGSRLRAIRQARNVGVRELARRLDLSPSAISQIENGKVNPSVRTLYAFAAEFGVTMDEMLFDQDAPPTRTAAPGPESSVTAAGPGLSVQRSGQRPSINLNSGVEWERLMIWSDEDVEFIEATYAPGGASAPDGKFVRHDGHEFGYILSGTLRVVVGFDDFVLGPGDSVSFPSTTPHRLSNEGDETVRAVWVVRGRRGVNVATDTPQSRNA
jgi:transcriptional regulator with XRE-family HTH domain